MNEEREFSSDAALIRHNLESVRRRTAEACRRAGRGADEVTICAVSKLKPISDIEAALDAGQHLFGENYVQELQKKTAQLDSRVEWHMIGHLQRNKVKYLIGKVAMIHSVDSLALAQQIEKEAARKDCLMQILMEVNIAREESKWGFGAEETADAAKQISRLPHLCLRGLMTSAPYTEDAETNRIYFRQLKMLYDRLAALSLPGTRIDTLSMGMTGDFEVAVEEGATMIRVGTAIFGERDYQKQR